MGETLPLVVFIPDYLKREPWDAQPSSTELLLDFTMAEYAALLGHPVGAYRVESSRGHDPSSSGGRGYWWNIQLLVAVTFIAVHLTAVQVLSPLTEEGQSFNSSIYSETLGNTLSTGDCDYHVPVRTSGQIRMLLILNWGCGDQPWS